MSPKCCCKNQGSRGVYEQVGGTSKCSEAEGKHKDDVPWPVFPERTSIVSRDVANLKTASQDKGPGHVSRSFSQGDWGCMHAVCYLHSVLGVVVCQELSL